MLARKLSISELRYHNGWDLDPPARRWDSCQQKVYAACMGELDEHLIDNAPTFPIWQFHAVGPANGIQHTDKETGPRWHVLLLGEGILARGRRCRPQTIVINECIHWSLSLLFLARRVTF